MSDDPFEAIRAHVEKHAGKERATFSIAGVKALLDAVEASLPEAPAVPVGVTVEMAERYSAGVDAYWKGRRSGRDGDAVMAGLRSALQSSPPVKAAAVDGPRVRQIIFDALDLSEELRIECTADVVNALTEAGVLASQNAVEGEAVAWRVRVNENGRVWYVYTEQLPYTPDDHIKVLSEPEPLYARPAAADAGDWKPTHQHLKRRSLYRFVGKATLQTSLSLRDMDAMVVYQAEDGSFWVRPDVEFYDGRFLALGGVG